MKRASILAMGLAFACAGSPGPATLDPHESCASCRMAVSDLHTAAQIAAPYEEPLFFDDIGCLRDYLRRGAALPRRAVAYVADHRTGEWVAACSATFTRCDAIETPMGSHLLAHASVTSRDADPAARGASVAVADVLPTGGSAR